MSAGAVTVIQADLDRADHQAAIIALTSAYAADAMGNGAPLSADVAARLVPGLQSLPTTMVFLAYEGERPVGIATCFLGFSTFLGRPLVNIHDLAVLGEHRGRGVGRAVLDAVERRARELGCGRLTLEVQENNARARATYARAGFAQASYGPSAGKALFYTKAL